MRGLLYNPRRAHTGRERKPRVPMNLADYLVILAVLLSAVIGAVRGFLREAVALVTLILALFLAWTFADKLAPHLGGLLKSEPVATWAARALIFFLVLLVGMAVAALLAYFVRLSLFSGTDRFLGFLFGLLRGFVMLGVFVILAQLLRLDDERWFQDSKLMPYGESVANGLRALVGDQLERHGRR
jgi:membrane protein required for colicin V production